ncbi:hypothetical protein LXL04_018253 [Taraxacum kok-saghyz]
MKAEEAGRNQELRASAVATTAVRPAGGHYVRILRCGSSDGFGVENSMQQRREKKEQGLRRRGHQKRLGFQRSRHRKKVGFRQGSDLWRRQRRRTMVAVADGGWQENFEC